MPPINTKTQTHTFPGGDESCQELAEVCSGVRVLLRQRESFQLRGGTSVLDVGFLQTGADSLEDRCSTHTQGGRAERENPARVNLVLRMPYLQRERGRNAGPPREAGRRRGARSSRCTGLPAQPTRTALQSSKTHRGKGRKSLG